MVTIDELRRKYKDFSLEGILILCKLLNVDKSYIYTYGEKQVSKEIKDKFIYFMENIIKGYPIQYILKEREFMGLEFYLEDGVLVPRPDTEILVEYVIDYINKRYNGKNIDVLDIGIGSGAISLSIANYCKDAEVYGIDIEDIPIKVANINKEKFDLTNVNFFKGDLFKALDGLDLKFHIIMSNPPYIASEKIKDLDIKVKNFEPRIALDGGMDGLNFYRQITAESKRYLVDNGLLIYEIGFDQGKSVSDILIKEGFSNVSILKDLQGLDRVVYGTKG
ncbi:peptide chain release factor N(5)-glutamine methyltransferase [Tissierella pigra]|uniref:peptide chain release factor N(5)-glutamine methyltransferase n=1 Tax=Tissierella pigra TaxID=2607614 RepID=UPI001C11EFA8|nr:peptide chain release factor N(5)-glutamine methyltransferase [Tissierella pigra]MBU5427861.1 peptide chain release factor N(5)-glutamine methyltransferase [Tissierella pigra]